jgi:uncharacterized protein YndB with AHSA1/START domain
MTTATTANKAQIIAEPGKLDLTIIREFDAPRELVFKAHTDKDLMSRWLGPSRLTTHWIDFEPREGGRWRYYSEDTDGSKYHFSGVFHYVNAPETVVQTFEFQGLPERGHVSLERLDLEDLPGGRTRLVAKSVFLTQEDRDGMIQSGMEGGVVEGYQRLDALLAEM